MMNIRGVMFYSIKNSLRFFVATIFCLMIFGGISSNNSTCLAAAGDSVITSVSCPSATEQAPVGSEIDFTSACTVNITVDAADTPVKLQVLVSDNVTTKTLGNGSNLSIISPENRLFANTTFAITQAASPVTVETGIVGNTTLNFNYKTWEGDTGGTDYTQYFQLRLLDSGDTPVTQGWYTTNTDFDFTTANVNSISISSAPMITLAANKAFTAGQTETATVTISVKANNSWIAKVKLADSPIPDLPDTSSNSIPISSNTFACSGQTDCESGTITFTTAYQDFAQSAAAVYTTGTTNGGRDLSTKNYTATFTLTTLTNPYDADTYGSDMTYQLTSPK